jgi:CRISPR-associated protein Cmr2
MTKHLFLFSLGPVQSFIAQARKTRDLYAGSSILSLLVQKAMLHFENEFPKGKIIFPSSTVATRNTSIPNRFIGKIEGTAEQLQEKARLLEDAVRVEFLKKAKESLFYAGKESFTAFEAQINAQLEIHWLYQPYQPSDEESFAKAFAALDTLEGSLKNIRQFQQYNYNGEGEQGRKCSIDGINNALFSQSIDGKPSLRNTIGIDSPLFNPGEGLSAVSLTKRFFKTETRFPSTAEVALMHDKTFLSGELKQELDKLDKQDFDYQLLFEENCIPKNIPDQNLFVQLKKLQPKFAEYLKTRYYALILFDGDEMGKWLSGKYNKAKNDLELFHDKFSGALLNFGQNARTHLCRENNNGQAVYAGGDDFLGLVNLHHLFDVMTYLRNQFDEQVNQVISPYKNPQLNQQLTFSAGIVIAHYKTPFSEVLKTARDMEKKAKKENEGQRNAFGITVLKKSGEIQESIFHWDADEKSARTASNWNALAHIVKSIDAEGGSFSNKFIQNLSYIFGQLTGSDLHPINDKSRNKEALQKALELEMERFIKRSYKFEGQETASAEKADLIAAVRALWANTKGPNKARYFIHALHIVDFLTRKTQKA